MAKHLDLEEQEQLAELKHFWKRYGNAITWALIVVFSAVAAWNGYHYWQRSQAVQAAVMYDEVERAAVAGDMTRLDRSLADMQERYGRTTYADQAAMSKRDAWPAGTAASSRAARPGRAAASRS